MGYISEKRKESYCIGKIEGFSAGEWTLKWSSKLLLFLPEKIWEM